MAKDQISRSHIKDFLNRPHSFNDDLKYNLRLIAGISIGMFLFFLFFQPLDLKDEEFNIMLDIISGFGFITFFILGLILIVIPYFFPRFFQTGKWNISRDIILNASIWLLISTSYSFYARYVGLIEITAHSMFKILLLGLAPVAILIVVNQNKILKRYLQNALDLTKFLETDEDEYAENTKEITIESDNKSETLKVRLNCLVLVRSANNYIEVFWKTDNEIQKKLLRNTLTKIENQLKNYHEFIRCHRTALVNKQYIDRKVRSTHGLHIKLKNIDELIPVSRQYSVIIKEQT
jgi:hypothetical protein